MKTLSGWCSAWIAQKNIDKKLLKSSFLKSNQKWLIFFLRFARSLKNNSNVLNSLLDKSEEFLSIFGSKINWTIFSFCGNATLLVFTYYRSNRQNKAKRRVFFRNRTQSFWGKCHVVSQMVFNRMLVKNEDFLTPSNLSLIDFSWKLLWRSAKMATITL